MRVLSEFPQVLAIVAMLQSCCDAQSLLDIANNPLIKEISSIKQPIAKVIFAIGSSQCENFKAAMKLQYNLVKDKPQPDAANLTIDYIAKNVTIKFKLSSAAAELPKSGLIDINKIVTIYLHGFNDQPDNNNFPKINNALQEKGNSNVLAVDSSSLTSGMYLDATTNLRIIAKALAELLAELVRLVGLLAKNIYLVGHSLGAHIAGLTGKAFKQLTGQLIGRITGLDPAGLCFIHVGDDDRLNKTDAIFVDVIHTNGGVFGLIDAVGHQDFFVNGGEQQSGCVVKDYVVATCSHTIATNYFADTVLHPDSYPAVQCKNYESYRYATCSNTVTLMGYAAAPGPEGLFYLQTNEKEPYYRGIEGTKYNNKDGIVTNILYFTSDLFTQ